MRDPQGHPSSRGGRRWRSRHGAQTAEDAVLRVGDTMNPMRRAPEQTPGPVDDAPDYVVLAVPPAALGSSGREWRGRASHRRSGATPLRAAAPQLGADRRSGPVLHAQAQRPSSRERRDDRLCLRSHVHRSVAAVGRPRPCRTSLLLTVAASDYWALLLGGPRTRTAQAMIRTLHDYVPDFDPGKKWGESADIDWTRIAL